MRLHPNNWSLATKWSLLVTVLALAPLLAVIRYSYDSTTTKIMEKTVHALANGASDGVASLDAMIDERVRQARYLSNRTPFIDFVTAPSTTHDAKRPPVQAEFQAMLQAYPYLESIDLMDAKGWVVHTSSGQKMVANDPDLIKTVKAGKVYMGGLQSQLGQSEPSLVIAAPIGPGAQQGILRTQSTPRALMNRVTQDDQREGSGALSILLDEHGRIITSSDPAGGGQSVQLDPRTATMTLANGRTYYAQSAHVRNLPWTYVLAVPAESVKAELRDQLVQSLVLALGSCLILGGLCRLLVLRATRPLIELAQASRAMAEGDLSYTVPGSGRFDEMGHLQTSFEEAHRQLRRLVARMRLSSHLVAEASSHLHTMTNQRDTVSSDITQATEKLSLVAQDLERQVAHFKI